MHQIIGWLLSQARTLLAPGTGRRARRPQRRTALRETALAWLTPPAAAPEPIHPSGVDLNSRPRTILDPHLVAAPTELMACPHLDEPPAGTLVRPYIDQDAWRRELDAIEAAYEARQQAFRRAAAAAAATNHPDPGYTYPGAHTLVGAVA
ncbi:hypothetical protein [Kitasatospora sp. A2-31]|uniref:hypothetical protein n=1 Tax=Kitasatospora sp. A2-31 TaxID=2916414 RepID=UPI001EED46FE|nr:hypothetical protein [Kitasatospora sp. A2-31]MCG6499171.1 hypothetical protein [Kitasatospora sp. A2-31]